MWPSCCCATVQCSELLLRPCNVIAGERGGQWEVWDACVQNCTPACDSAIDAAFVAANLTNEMVDFSDDEQGYIQGTPAGDVGEPGNSRVAFTMECYQCFGDGSWVSTYLSSVDLVKLRVRMRFYEESNDYSAGTMDTEWTILNAPAMIPIEVTNQGDAGCKDDNWETYQETFVPITTNPEDWNESTLQLDVVTAEVPETIVKWAQFSAIELELTGTAA